MPLIRFIKNSLFIAVYLLLIISGLYACASIGNPSGGDYDVKPPQFTASKPARDAIEFKGNKIEIQFDEFISIEKPSEKVIITPPQQKSPVIRAVGRKITVELKDSLIPNTTYTFDFTDAIVDNNEKNPIEGFSFAFSTGAILDSLIISGILLNAENLEPMPNVMIGLHVNREDSAFTSLPFMRTSQTNDRGMFWIRNVAPGAYRIFALTDMNRNFKFDQPGEAIAFCDSLIVPSFEPAIRMDTIWKDSLTVDTIREIQYTRFTPDDVKLFLFREEFEPQYFSKIERPDEKRFILHFNSEKALPPDLHLTENNPENDRFIREFSPDRKSITYWISDSLVYKRDTLRMEVTYCVDDSLNQLITRVDTLQAIFRKREVSSKDKEAKIDFLGVEITPSGMMNVYDTLKITFSEPLPALDIPAICFQQKVDTLWEDRDFPLIRDSLNPRLYYVFKNWPYGQEYQVKIDSAAIYSIYNKWNNSVETKLKTPDEEEYGHLYVIIEGNEGPGWGQLLDGSDKIVKESALYDGELIFENIKPGKYYLRYIDDVNGNGKWDAGNYAEKRQSESVYYYHSFFEIRKFSEFEQNWNIKEFPFEKQKPLEITKNKPVEKKPKRNEQNANQRNSNSTRTSSMSGMPRL
ncbi:MAG: Ig-like domain-containing protein [Dysgonamonadaceae bacterium]|nr:Ig-like domain-containing protein [Dysgonamonadaceae bacterium]